MRIGTKSILFGAHQFVIHPLFVALAWWRLYGFPFDPRLWLAFFLHDLGYWGKPNMDGPEGERHVELGAKVMGFLFGSNWHRFCLYHSRFYAKRDNATPSRLCVADKLSIVLTPAWLYLPAAIMTGEIDEYMKLSEARTAAGEPKYSSLNVYSDDRRQWYANVQEYLRRWVREHKDGKSDRWTPDTGVWQ